MNSKGNDGQQGSAGAPKKTVKSGIDALSNGGTLIITNGTYYENGIYINKNITIKGTGTNKVVINAKSKHLFTIAPNCHVTLCNITIKNAKSANGGAIYNKGSLTVNNVIFNSNIASNYGGAIYNKGKLYISNSQFIKNTAKNGAAIYTTNSIQISNTIFKSNSASNLGSAIYSTNKVSISRTNFTNNINSAIYLSNTYKSSIHSSKFVSNKGNNGAAIFNNGHTLTLTKTYFQYNNATQQGGAIYSKGKLIIVNSTFKNNYAKKGAGIYTIQSIEVSKTLFKKNSAKNIGAGIYSAAKISLSNVNFTSNINTAVYLTKLTTSIINSGTFLSNTGTRGAAIHSNGSNIKINKTYFKNNQATGFGGAIYTTGVISSASNTFISNKGINGGAIYTIKTLNVNNNKFDSNSAKYSGGGIFTTGNLTVKNSKFINNKVNNHGGSIYSSSNTPVTTTIASTTFTSNTAGNAGGIYVYGKDKLSLTNSVFHSNNNRALYIKTNSVTNTIYNCNFTNNKANSYGGAIYTENSQIKINKTNFKNNIALKSGGALYNKKGTVNIVYSIIIHNNRIDVINNNGTITANYNWWGTNNKPGPARQKSATINNWIYFKVTSSSGKVGDTITTKAALYLYTTTAKTLPNPEYLPSMTIKLTINGGGISKTYTTSSASKSLTVSNKYTKTGTVKSTGYTYNATYIVKKEISTSKSNDNKRITSLFVQIGASVSSSAVKQWVNAGITDVYVQCRVSTNNVAKLKEVINLCKNTNIRVHSWIICFSTDNGFDVSASRQTTVKNFIKNVIKISGVDGVCLDYVRYSGSRYGVDSTVITNFVKSVNSIIKGYNSKIQLSACVFAEKSGTKAYYGQDYAALSKYLDVELLMAYRYDYNSGRSWITDVTKYAANQATSCKVVTVLQTYDKSINPLSKSTLEADISAAISGGSYGYSLFRYGLISSYPKDATKF